jgi:virulence factor Mce-like protein
VRLVNKQGPSIGQLVMMVAFALSCFGLLLFLWSAFGGPVPLRAKPYEVTTQFRAGSQLASYADVRVSGVTVGKVVKIEKLQRTAKVTMNIEPKYAPLPTDTRATLRTKTLLGETFVELSFGSRRAAAQRVPGSFIQDGGAIASKQVRPTAELDQILDAFDDRTRQDLRRFFTSVAGSLDGRGEDLNSSVGDFGPTVRAADGLLRVLDRQSAAVRSGTRDLGTTFAAVGSRAGALQELIRSGRQVVDTTSAITPALRQTTRILPTFLDETRSTLRVARAASADAAPTLAALRPVAPLIRPALQDLAVLAPQLERTLVQLGPVLPKVESGLPALRRILDSSGPFMDSLAPVTRDLLPALQYLYQYRREIPVTFANAAAATQFGVPDATGTERKVLRQPIVLNDELLMGAKKRLPTNRANAYPLPGTLDQYGTGRSDSFSCENTGNPGGLLSALLGSAGNVPCRQQGPLTQANGTTQQFPHVLPVSPDLSNAGTTSPQR